MTLTHCMGRAAPYPAAPLGTWMDTMKKVAISVLGQDRPGIIAAISRALLDVSCNIENVNQTILQNEFSSIFLVAMPPDLSIAQLTDALHRVAAPMDLQVFVKPMTATESVPQETNSAPYVVTTMGPDRKGLVAGITAILADHQVNVTNLQAVFKGGDDPLSNVMIYEIDVPVEVDVQQLRAELGKAATELGLDINIQHRRIFETLHRV